MELSNLDWSFIAGFFVISLAIGLVVARKSGKSASDFFLSGRNMPWWLLGVSMVATTFSADTPNLVTDIVRKDGVAGNWVWWAFLITGMLTVFVYARLWRRSGVLTDLEFYEMRYSGKEAAFLRGFRSLYLGVVFNILVMATVCLAAIKIGGVLMGLSPMQTLLISSVVTVAYSAIGGLRGIILTDFFQFILAMIGTIWAAMVIVDLPEVGGLQNLISHPNVVGKLDFFPTDNSDLLWSLLIIPLAVQWWAAYYPGSEPGGGGYIAQRMLAAKDEKHAMGATLLFNIAHYALRPWPWILIALASLIIFPDIASLQEAFPAIDPQVVNDDLAYPAMLTFLPAGLLGLVIASLIAAFMSTISTHLNWGSSYISNDFYKRFVNPDASEKQLVTVGRVSTVLLMIIAAGVALLMENAKQAFDIIILMGAGTGLLFILRWFWWRINAYSELAAMVISFLVAIVFKFILPKGTLEGHTELILSVLITTIGWVTVTYLTPAVEQKKLIDFYKLIKPHNIGWRSVVEKGIASGEIPDEKVTVGKLPMELSGMFAGIFLVYGMLFTTGFWLYGELGNAAIGAVISVASGMVLWRVWRR